MSDERNNGFDAEERRVRDTLRSVASAPARAAFRERLKREFVDGTIERPESSAASPRFAFPRWGWLLVPAAALLLIAILFLPRAPAGWRLVEAEGEGSIAIDGRSYSVADRDGWPGSIDPGRNVKVDDGVRLAVSLDKTLLLELDEGADVALPVAHEDPAQPLTAEVRRGELRIKTGPAFAGRSFHILTPESRTEIVGTMVSVFRGDGLTCVCVLEGTAQIGIDEDDLEAIPAGQRKVMFADGRPSMVTAIQPDHAAGLEEFILRHGDLP